MSHRGRLNVILNIVQRPAAEIFAGFEDVDPRSVLGGGDVKYHIGATGIYTGASGRQVRIHLVSNPSHLEAVDPVALGRARAKQTRLGRDGKTRVLPVLMHGDSAFAGQGITAETLNLANLRGYTVGGTVHIIVNNLIGFTTNPSDAYSGRFSSDLAKRLPIPIFHVNGEDADAVVRAGRMALEYRYEFGTDVVWISSASDGMVIPRWTTRPSPSRFFIARSKTIPCSTRSTPRTSVWIRSPTSKSFRPSSMPPRTPARAWSRSRPCGSCPAIGRRFTVDRQSCRRSGHRPFRREAAQITDGLVRYPEDFHIHPKVQKLLEQRREMGYGKRPLDFGMAEALAFGSLAMQGTPIRLSGQDSRRGTFNQRHSVLIDMEDEKEYVPCAIWRPTGPG